MDSKVAVVILNWNGKKLLERFLPSLVEHTKNAAIYIADNGSTDDSVSFIENNYPHIQTIVFSENKGFCKGYNAALNQIDADIFILLNSDVEVTPGWINPLIHLLDTNSSVGACQPKIKDLNKKNHFEYAGAAGGFIDHLGYPFCRGRIFDTIEEDKGQYNSDIEVFWASGACLAIRSSIFKEEGGFDESFFAHMEEIDLCWRISNKGHKIYCCANSEVYHLGGGSLNKINPRKTYLNFRNNFMMLLKNLDSASYIKVIPLRLMLDGVAGVKFLIEGNFSHCWAIIRAHFYCYVNLKTIRKKRKKDVPKLTNKKGVYRGSIVKAYYLNNIRSYLDVEL